MTDRKEAIVKFRIQISEKEKLKMEAEKKNLTMSEYVRRVIVTPPPVTQEEFENVKMQLLYEIRKIGVNINQIAKKYNEYYYVEPREELMDKMERIEDLTKQILKVIMRR